MAKPLLVNYRRHTAVIAAHAKGRSPSSAEKRSFRSRPGDPHASLLWWSWTFPMPPRRVAAENSKIAASLARAREGRYSSFLAILPTTL